MAETTGPGLRERNRIDKRQRIREAARAAFEEKGFDGATLREIARAAGVGLGTLFLYASDKRDLLFLIFTDELEALYDRAFATGPGAESFLDEIVTVFDPYYRYFAAEAGLARDLLRELTFFTQGVEGQRFQANRRRVIDGLAARCGAAQASGRAAPSADPATVARVLFAVYQAELREWLLAARPDPDAGLGALRAALLVVADGLAA